MIPQPILTDENYYSDSPTNVMKASSLECNAAGSGVVWYSPGL
jgi:hypothetical protein